MFIYLFHFQLRHNHACLASPMPSGYVLRVKQLNSNTFQNLRLDPSHEIPSLNFVTTNMLIYAVTNHNRQLVIVVQSIVSKVDVC